MANIAAGRSRRAAADRGAAALAGRAWGSAFMLRVRGVACAAAGAAVLAALASWRAGDPSLNVAAGERTHNLLGGFGAVLADGLMQSLGLGAAVAGSGSDRLRDRARARARPHRRAGGPALARARRGGRRAPGRLRPGRRPRAGRLAPGAQPGRLLGRRDHRRARAPPGPRPRPARAPDHRRPVRGGSAVAAGLGGRARASRPGRGRGLGRQLRRASGGRRGAFRRRPARQARGRRRAAAAQAARQAGRRQGAHRPLRHPGRRLWPRRPRGRPRPRGR